MRAKLRARPELPSPHRIDGESGCRRAQLRDGVLLRSAAEERPGPQEVADSRRAADRDHHLDRADLLPPTPPTSRSNRFPGWDSEVLDVLRRMNQLKFPHGCPLDFAINTLDVILLPDPLGILVAEVSDHTISI